MQVCRSVYHELPARSRNMSIAYGCSSLDPGPSSVHFSGVQDTSPTPLDRLTDPQELFRLVQDGSEPLHLIDVRSPEEFADGHIPTAVNIPFQLIEERVPTTDRDVLMVLYCQSGGRSAVAKAILQDIGYHHVVNFGAIADWPGTLER